MRLNQKKTLFESFQQNLHEDSWKDSVLASYEHFSSDLGKKPTVDDIYMDLEKQGIVSDESPEDGAQTVKDIKYILNHENLEYLDEAEVTECDKPVKVSMKEAFLYSRQKLKESVQGLAEVIWGSDVIADEEHMGEDFKVFQSLCTYIDGLEDALDDGDISKVEFMRELKAEGASKGLNEEEIDKLVKFYNGSVSEPEEDTEFTMYNPDYDKEVRVWKQDGKWYDSDGNRYMGYLTKQDVKSYFKGNYKEM